MAIDKSTLTICPIEAGDILETIGDACFALERDLTIKWANTKALSFWGMTSTDCIGRPVAEVFPGLAGSVIAKELDAVESTGESRHFETIWPGHASPFHVDLHATRSAILAYFRPVSVRPRSDGEVSARYDALELAEKRAAESALRESEGRFSHVFDQSPLGKAMAGPDFRLRAVNPALCQMLGYQSDELVGRPFTDFVHPDDLATCLSAAQSLVDGKLSKIQLEERFVRKGGAPLWVRVTVGPILDENGNLVHTLAILQDIDEHRRIVQALRDSEERLRNLNETLEQQAEERARQLASSRAQLQAFFDNSPDWLTLLKGSPDGQFTFVDINPTSEAAYGLPREQVIGRSVEAILGKEAAQTPLRYFTECVRTGVPQRYYASRTMAERTRSIDVMAVLVPGPDTDGNQYIITTARDMTDREAIEAQLRQAQKMEAVGHLTGGIAHDFNNILTAISGNLELLQRRIDSGRASEATKYIAAAQSAASRAAALTHRLLAFARRQPLDPEPIDADQLVRSMEDLLRRTLGPSIDLHLNLTDQPWLMLSDRNQLENAILNLAINARDAMPDGGRLEVRTENVQLADNEIAGLSAGDHVALSVIDSGWGMPPEVIARAFEPFFTTKPQGKGTGLGLSMLYGFVEQSGGQVRIDSTVGVGTTVRIYLPRHEAKVSSDTNLVELPASQRPPPAAASGKTVVIVEDEAAIRDMISGVLKDLGYAVVEAQDGPSALRILDAADRVDLMVTDVGLPGGLNGRQVADAARVRRPNLRVLFITGFSYNSELGRGTALDPGMEIMRKPFTLAGLAAKVNELISLESA